LGSNGEGGVEKRKEKGRGRSRAARSSSSFVAIASLLFISLSLSSPAHDGDRHLLLAEERLVEAPVGSSGLDDDGDRGGLTA